MGASASPTPSRPDPSAVPSKPPRQASRGPLGRLRRGPHTEAQHRRWRAWAPSAIPTQATASGPRSVSALTAPRCPRAAACGVLGRCQPGSKSLLCSCEVASRCSFFDSCVPFARTARSLLCNSTSSHSPADRMTWRAAFVVCLACRWYNGASTSQGQAFLSQGAPGTALSLERGFMHLGAMVLPEACAWLRHVCEVGGAAPECSGTRMVST